MFVTEVAIASILRARSCCIVWVLLINSSSFSLLFLRAPIIEVTPTASVVHAAKTSAGLSGLGSGTFSLCLGERDRSCSAPSRSITGDLLCSSWCPCMSWSPCSEPDSKVVPCPGSGRFSVGGTLLGIDALAITLKTSSESLVYPLRETRAKIQLGHTTQRLSPSQKNKNPFLSLSHSS